MNIDLTHLNHQTFERLCNDLLDIEIGDVKPIEGSGGDKGVDGFRGEISGSVEIYQHKFFTHALKSSQKSQIKDSFDTAKENHPNMKKWVLLIARDLTHTKQEWFEEEFVHANPDIEISYWGKQEIERRVTKYNTLVERYFPQTMLALGRRGRDFIDWYTGTPIDQAGQMRKKLEEIRTENPRYGLDYEFSSIDDTHRVTLNPDTDIKINTQLRIDEEKAERIHAGRTVRFGEDEIQNIEFSPELLADDELQPQEMVLKPWYENWEQAVQIEVPSGSFRKEMTMVVESVSDDSITFKAESDVLGVTVEYSPDIDETTFSTTADLEDKPVFQISEYFEFVEQLKTHEKILIRELDDGSPVLIGDIKDASTTEPIDGFQELIEDLEVIETHTGTAFVLTDEFDEDDELNAIIAGELLADGETQNPFELNAELLEGREEEVIRIDEEDDSPHLVVKWKDFELPIAGETVSIGPVQFKYPNATIANIEEIRSEAGQPGSSDLVIRPSEDAIIKTIEDD